MAAWGGGGDGASKEMSSHGSLNVCAFLVPRHLSLVARGAHHPLARCFPAIPPIYQPVPCDRAVCAQSDGDGKLSEKGKF